MVIWVWRDPGYRRLSRFPLPDFSELNHIKDHWMGDGDGRFLFENPKSSNSLILTEKGNQGRSPSWLEGQMPFFKISQLVGGTDEALDRQTVNWD